MPDRLRQKSPVDAKEPIGRDDEIEEVISLHTRRKASVIDERSPHRQVLVVGEAFHLLRDFVNYFVSDLLASLDFNDDQRALGLYEEIYLASAMAFRRRLTVRERRKYKGLVYSQIREQVVDVVEDQVLELEAVKRL